MAEIQQEELSYEQGSVAEDVEQMVFAAIGAQCAGCSTADFAPRRLGTSVARERLPVEGAEAFAQRLKTCRGLGHTGTYTTCRLPNSSVSSSPGE